MSEVRTKIVINCDYGGFSISHDAGIMLALLGNAEAQEMLDYAESEGFWSGFMYKTPRHDPQLIQVVESLGVGVASGTGRGLAIEEIDGTLYRIQEYDGMEEIVTPATETWIDASKSIPPMG